MTYFSHNSDQTVLMASQAQLDSLLNTKFSPDAEWKNASLSSCSRENSFSESIKLEVLDENWKKNKNPSIHPDGKSTN